MVALLRETQTLHNLPFCLELVQRKHGSKKARLLEIACQAALVQGRASRHSTTFQVVEACQLRMKYKTTIFTNTTKYQTAASMKP